MNHYLFWFIFIDMININTYLNENPTQHKPIPNLNQNLNRIIKQDIAKQYGCKYAQRYCQITDPSTSAHQDMNLIPPYAPLHTLNRHIKLHFSPV